MGLVTISPHALANDFERGIVAYLLGDYETAITIWTPLAEQGDAIAQGGLGGLYALGQGVPQNYRLAAEWYRKAAEQGLAEAQFNLSIAYASGRGVPQDYQLAYQWANLAQFNGQNGAKDLKERLKEKMTDADILKAQAMSRTCLESAYTDC